MLVTSSKASKKVNKEVLGLVSWMLNADRAKAKGCSMLKVVGRVADAPYMLIVNDNEKGRKMLVYTTSSKAGDRLLKIRLMRPYDRNADLSRVAKVRDYAGRTISRIVITGSGFALD